MKVDDKGRIYIEVKCVQCGERRRIYLGELGADDFPMCKICFSPMMPIEAKIKNKRERRKRNELS